MTLQTEKEAFITVQEYGEVYNGVLFRDYNWIVENWLPRRPVLKQHLEIDFPVGTTPLTPGEVAYVWRMLETKHGDYNKVLHQEMKKYIIRTGAIGVIEDKMNLVYNRDFNSGTLLAIILNPEIQTPNQEYAKQLDEIIVKRINSGENPSLDDLVNAKAKFVGGGVYTLPPLLRETHSDGLLEDVAFLGATRANFPAGVKWHIDTDYLTEYARGYGVVYWDLSPADGGSSRLALDDHLEDSYSLWGSLQGRRSADSSVFYRKQLEQLQSKLTDLTDARQKLLQAISNLE